MANFAKIGLNNKVIEVQAIHNDVLLDSNGVEQESIGLDFLTKLTGWAVWKQTSYNGNIRKNYAGVGHTYDEVRDAFYVSKPFVSWTLNESTCQWEAPVAFPADGNEHKWDEDTQQWIRVNEGD
jgi:hypothetical protein